MFTCILKILVSYLPGVVCLKSRAFSHSINTVLFTSYHLLIGGSVLCRKKLFSSVHYFVHLNLAISLLLGYIVFIFGIELGTSSKVYNPLSITH